MSAKSSAKTVNIVKARRHTKKAQFIFEFGLFSYDTFLISKNHQIP